VKNDGGVHSRDFHLEQHVSNPSFYSQTQTRYGALICPRAWIKRLALNKIPMRMYLQLDSIADIRGTY
jgi:hypothetical protein